MVPLRVDCFDGSLLLLDEVAICSVSRFGVWDSERDYCTCLESVLRWSMLVTSVICGPSMFKLGLLLKCSSLRMRSADLTFSSGLFILRADYGDRKVPFEEAASCLMFGFLPWTEKSLDCNLATPRFCAAY